MTAWTSPAQRASALKPFGIAIEQRQAFRAFAHGKPRERRADAGRSAGDQRDLAGEAAAHATRTRSLPTLAPSNSMLSASGALVEAVDDGLFRFDLAFAHPARELARRARPESRRSRSD